MKDSGLKAVPPNSKEPNEYYDSLDQDAKDIWDEIGAQGYTPRKGHGGLLWARRTGSTDDSQDIGPADSLIVLRGLVKDYVAEEARLLAENGSNRLPTMEEPATDELDRLADRLLEAREKKDKARAEFKDEEEIFRGKMNDLHRKKYIRKGMHIILEDSQHVTYKKAEGTAKTADKKAA